MNTNKVLWIDFIRVTAVFFVVFLHSAAPLLYRYNNISSFNWWTGNIYDSLVRTCVPLFFMASGYLLLEKQETIKTYVHKRLNKILVPWFVWSIFYILWKRYYLGSEDITPHSFFNMFFAPTFFHLWFLYALIGLYLYIPILRILVQNSPQEYLYYFVALWFVAVSVIPFIEKVTDTTSIIDLKMISGHVGYLVLGHLLGHAQINKRQIILAIVVIFGSAITTIVGTAFLTIRNNGIFSGYFYNILSPNVILLSISTFVILKHLSDTLITSTNRAAILQRISSASFGIYLTHPIAMEILGRFSLNVIAINALYSVPAMAILAFGISLGITVLLQQIPFVRKIVP